eukprot:10639159-Alexandrium_andersonii.AAC.1
MAPPSPPPALTAVRRRLLPAPALRPARCGSGSNPAVHLRAPAVHLPMCRVGTHASSLPPPWRSPPLPPRPARGPP